MFVKHKDEILEVMKIELDENKCIENWRIIIRNSKHDMYIFYENEEDARKEFNKIIKKIKKGKRYHEL